MLCILQKVRRAFRSADAHTCWMSHNGFGKTHSPMNGIKLIGTILFLIGVASCESKQTSMAQAQMACAKWEKLGTKATGTITIQPEQTEKMERAWDIDTDYGSGFAENWMYVEEKRREWMSQPQTHTYTSVHSRECVNDKDNNQFLGKENKEIASGNYRWMEKEGEWEIVIRYRY